MSWIDAKNGRFPELDTPVLVVYDGEIRIGVLCRENPSFEDNYQAFSYWDDAFDEGQDWDFHSVTHWQPLPELPRAPVQKFIYELFMNDDLKNPRLELDRVEFSSDGYIKYANVINGGWDLRRDGDSYNACDGTFVVNKNIFNINSFILVKVEVELPSYSKKIHMNLECDDFDDDIAF